MLRKLLACLAGILVMGVTVGLVEGMGHALFPPPEGLDLSNPEHLAGLMEQIPWQAKLMVLLAWAGGALAGSLVAGQIARAAPLGPCLVVAVAMLLGTAVSLWMIPHPWWMAAAGIALPLPIAWACARWISSRTTVEAAG